MPRGGYCVSESQPSAIVLRDAGHLARSPETTSIKISGGKWSAEQFEGPGQQLMLNAHLASEVSLGKKIATQFLVVTKTEEFEINVSLGPLGPL